MERIEQLELTLPCHVSVLGPDSGSLDPLLRILPGRKQGVCGAKISLGLLSLFQAHWSVREFSCSYDSSLAISQRLSS
jgi:hypothetical protein